jgi:hypothetical protein
MARRLFLERRTYRQNRLQDAARLLPVLGLMLVFAPIFIRGEPAEGETQLSGWLVYYFTVWVGLIGLTAFVSRALMRGEASRREDADGEAR